VRKRLLVIVVAVASFSFVPAGPAAASGPLFGFADSSALYPYEGAPSPERLAELEAEAGAEVARFSLHWEAVQPLPPLLGSGYRWARFDRFVAALEQRGIRPLPVLIGAPGWAREPPPLCAGTLCPPARWRLDEWAAFAAAVARRYPQAAAIEVWNEPNHGAAWQTLTGPNPGRYARLFSRAARAIRAVDPGLPVLIGSVGYTHPDGGSPRDMAIGEFLGRFYDSVEAAALHPGVRLGLHVYPGAAELGELRADGQFASTLAEARAVRDARDPGRTLWITEVGASTTLERDGEAVSETEQASAVLNALDALEAAPDIGAALVYTVVDRAPRWDPAEEGFGLVRRGPGFEPKPAYCAIAARRGEPRPAGCD
jgi:hypothetical protein